MGKTIIPESQWEEALREWSSAKALIWMYHATHRRLLIRLMKEACAQDLYIAAVGCCEIHGPLSWSNSRLELTRASSSASTRTTKIEDATAQFSLKCSDVALATGAKTDYDVRFEGILGDEFLSD